MATNAGLPWEGYLRVSAVGRRDRIISPPKQRQAIERKAGEMGVTLARFTKNVNVSGRNIHSRDDFLEIIRRIERGEIGGIIVAKVDRFARNTRDALNLLHPIEYRIAIANLPIDTSTSVGRQQLRDHLSAAEAIGDQIAEEFEESKAQAIANGTPINSHPAVGLRYVWVDNPDPDENEQIKNLAHDPAVAPVVAEVFHRRIAGDGPAALGALLENHGIRTSQGSVTWSKQAVYGLLRNPIYKGVLRYGKNGDRHINPSAVEPIVEVGTWQAAQGSSARAPRLRTETNLLAGTLRCENCRYCLQGTTTSRGKRIYRCTRTHAGGVCPEPARVDAGLAEAAAIDAFWKITADLEARGVDDHHDVLATVTAEARKAQQAFEQLMSPDVRAAVGDTSEWAAMLTRARAERDRTALAEARERASAPSVPVATATLREAWERMTTADRRELMMLRFDCIALRRRPLSLVVFPAGSGPSDLPRRGFKREPVLSLLDVPAEAWVVPL